MSIPQPSPDQNRAWPRLLLRWYDAHRRDLPWRRTKDPYAIFVSEMMLQQTQVQTVIPFYLRWLKELPDWDALARAPEDRVLKLWEGLGYYRRARNLKAAAQRVLSDYAGRLPDRKDEILTLPGVGPYSAGALLSIAHGKPEALVDGNVIRVYARLFALGGDLKSGPGNRKVWALAEKWVSQERPGDFNQALMELGATVCLTENPQCLLCPLRALCRAAHLGRQGDFPKAGPKARNRSVAMAAAWIARGQKVLLRKRPDDVRWLKGLWEFPSGEGRTHSEAKQKLGKELGVVFGGKPAAKVKHQITVHKIEIRLYRAVLPQGWKPPAGARWVGPGDWGRYALPSAHLKLQKLSLQ
jgi:A/G-specific adenine glycosylase